MDEKSQTAGSAGFLKCDISIIAQGTTSKAVEDEYGDDEFEVENHILVPSGAIKDRYRGRVVFSVFRADSFSPRFFELPDSKIIQPFVKITYGGWVKQTNIAKTKNDPVWNEELSFLDVVPPLCRNIFIELCDRQKALHRGSVGNTSIDISTLYEDGVNGFLPTFGPNFVYLYRPLRKFEAYKPSGYSQNSFTYSCRLLLAIRTELLNFAEDVKVLKKKQLKLVPKAIAPIVESVYFEYKKFILFGVIFDVLFFDNKIVEKNVNIRITMGPKKNMSGTTVENIPAQSEKKKKRAIRKRKKKNKTEKSVVPEELKKSEDQTVTTYKPTGLEDSKKNGNKGKIQESETSKAKNENKLENPTTLRVITTCNTTSQQHTSVIGDYSFMNFSGTFPCVHVYGEWPDFLRKMHHTNVIKNIVKNYSIELNQIKSNLKFENENKSEFSKKLKQFLSSFPKSCENIIRLTNFIRYQDTNLTRERKRFYETELLEMAKTTKSVLEKGEFITLEEMTRISPFLNRLAKYAQDPENSFPETEIWVLRNRKITAQYRIKTEDIAYSANSDERGIMSGKIQSLLLRGKKNRVKAKLDIFLWFGLAQDFTQCMNMLPQRFQHNHRTCPSSANYMIPTDIIYEEKHHFQCRAHIFRAKFKVGADKSGLSDPYIRVIIFGQSKITQSKKATLCPVWDETLLFPKITLFGPAQFYRDNPIPIIVEAFDKETSRRSELIGRSFVQPVVKVSEEEYKPPRFPPKLKWEIIQFESREVGQILMAIEFLELSANFEDVYSVNVDKASPLIIPDDIRPHNVEYRMEIIFWGLREITKKKSSKNKFFVVLECGEKIITSPKLKYAQNKLNFPYRIEKVNLDLPEEPDYLPPIALKLYKIGSFTKSKNYMATCIVPTVRFFMYFLNNDHYIEAPESNIESETSNKPGKIKNVLIKSKMLKTKFQQLTEKFLYRLMKYLQYFKLKVFKKLDSNAYEGTPVAEDETLDWWTRYHMSTGTSEKDDKIPCFKVYKEELELQPEFEGFTDFLSTFNMVIGNEKVVAKVKAALKVYRWSENNVDVKAGKNLNHESLFSRWPTNDPIRILVRIYIICGKNLSPRDIYGKSDPYLTVQLGDKTINDRANYRPKQLNPTFGKCFEFRGTFPEDHLLKIKVLDYDVSSKDDLIGETTIDIENRYYSKHHGTCGITEEYENQGFYKWRDIYQPKDILKRLCIQSNFHKPIYETDKVLIENHTFPTHAREQSKYREEEQALSVLKRWHEIPERGFSLVPEHIETRSLYHPLLPGIEQGKLEMWVDIFPADFRYMPPKVDIQPRTAIPMELRAIVWNVDDVTLDDKTLFFNERMSDIYVKGWLLSLEEESQRTDIHYRSLNGEGNFNWRFIFHFNYIPAERMMVVKKKMNAFDMHPEERKHECKLEIQIWDNDAFGDDYLGTLILELCSMPRGAKLSSRCTLKMLASNASKINLFKIKKTRGWWPFR